MEFSKILLLFDYLLLVVFFVCAIYIPEVDFGTIIIAWMAQIGVSSAAYYWKAKTENRSKIPLKVIESLPENMQSKIDLTQIITTIITSE
jgi:hypothetical protein